MPNPIKLDPNNRLDPERGTLQQCNQTVRGSIGLKAAEYALEQVKTISEKHRRAISRRRFGTHYGSYWYAKFARNQAKKTVKKMDLVETNCVDFVIWAIECYYFALDALFPDPYEFYLADARLSVDRIPSIVSADECTADQLLILGERARTNVRQSIETARDADSRGSTLYQELRRRDGWKTVYFSPSNSQIAKRTARSMEAPAHSPDREVTGIKTGQPVNVITGIDKVIIGYSNDKKKQADMKKLAQTPFGVGFNRWGKHTFVIGKGSLYEVHYDKGPRNPKVFDRTEFFSKIRQWQTSIDPQISGVVAIPEELWPY